MTARSIAQAPDYIADLETTIEHTTPWLESLDEPVVSWRPNDAAWSAKEIIGHLIDSAANNHIRFVNAGIEDVLVFQGYKQEEWVRAQAYAAAPWTETVALWHSYNRHLARVMAAVPIEFRERRHARHNLHEIGWRPFSTSEPATLDDLMRDYVGHLKHHLAQVHDRIRGAVDARGGTTA